MKVLTALFVMFFVRNIKSKLNTPIEHYTYSNNFKDTIHSIIDVIRKSDSRPLATIVIQENCFHHSKELYKNLNSAEYFPAITLQMTDNSTLDLGNIFPEELLFRGIIGVPRVIFWFVEKNDIHFWNYLEKLSDTFLGNPRIPFIIIITSQDQNEINKFKEDCQKTWDEYQILNIVLIYSRLPFIHSYEKEMDSFLLSTTTEALFFNQFQNKGSFLNLTKEFIENKNYNLLSNKLIDINGYEIKVTEARPVFGLKLGKVKAEYSGVDVLINRMNATKVTIISRLQENVKADNNLSLSETEVVPDMFGNIFAKHLKNQNTSSVSFDQSCISILVPKAKRIPQFLNIVLPYTWETWALVFGSLPIITLLWKLFRHDLTLEVGTLLETVRIFVSGSTNTELVFSPQRLLVISFLLVSLVLMGSFQGSLTSYLTIPHYYPDINTLEDFSESELALALPMMDGLDENINGVLEDADHDDLYVKLFLQRGYIEKDVKNGLNMVAFNRTTAYVDASYYIQLYIKLNEYYKDGYPLMHIMNICPYTIRLTFHFPYVSPFQDRMDHLIMRGVEAGLNIKWFNDDIYELTLSGYNRVKAVMLKPLGLAHVQTSFYILFGGMILSFVSLICEILAIA